jgi:hypothetical protein
MAASSLLGVGGNIRWYYDTLTPSIAALPAAVNESLEQLMEELAQQVQQYAVANAPWNDRTGAARDGLTAEASSEGPIHRISLYHTADHGPWLEVRWSGTYAIIQPTIEAMGPVVMASLEGLLGWGIEI